MRLLILLFILFHSHLFGEIIDISKEWEFFCNNKKPKIVNLPYQENNIFENKVCYFKKRLIISKKIENLSFILGKVKTFSKVYFNKNLVLTVGKIGNSLVEGTRKVLFFTVPSQLIKKENEILIKVLSSDVTIGIYSGPILMGNFKDIFTIAVNTENKTKFFELFSIGVLLVIAGFLVFVYLNGIKEKEYISFGLFVFAYLTYFIFNSLIFYNFEIEYSFIQKLGLSIFLILPILIMYFFSSTIGFKISKFIKIINILILVISIVFFLAENSIKLITFLKFLWLFIIAIYILRIFYLCFKNINSYSLPEFKPVIIGLIILCLTGINDLIGLTDSDIFDYGMIIFIFFITYALTVRFARLNFELREFSSKLIKVRDYERKKLGQELHDGLGQVLVALKLNLQMFFGEKKGFYKKIVDEVSFAINELKNICENLRPAVLENLGFISAVKYFLEKSISHIKYKFNYDKDIKLSNEIEENLFRIFQECLNNAIKHSQADFIEVELKKFKNKIIFKFIDNGKGFDNEEEIKTKGLGLLSIKERCAMMNAKLSIESQKNKGLKIIIEIPTNGKN